MKNIINTALLAALTMGSIAHAEQEQLSFKEKCKKAAPYLKATGKTVVGLGLLSYGTICGILCTGPDDAKTKSVFSFATIFQSLGGGYLFYDGIKDFHKLYKKNKETTDTESDQTFAQ